MAATKKKNPMRIQLPFVSTTIGQVIVDALDHLYGSVDECYEEQDRASARRDIRMIHDCIDYQLANAHNGVRVSMKAVDSPDDLED